jgi:ferrous iron transport protein A
MKSLAELRIGENAVIRSFVSKELSAKLIELGCLPGETISISKTAPLGCPIAFNVGNSELSLRKEEASGILVEPVS